MLSGKWHRVPVKKASRLKGILATLVVAALAFMPIGEAVAFGAPPSVAAEASDTHKSTMDMVGMADMEGMAPADGMPCCPDDQKQAATDCGKSACPSMSACTAQCIPAGPSAAIDIGWPKPSAPCFCLPGERLLTSLAQPPPPRPPRT